MVSALTAATVLVALAFGLWPITPKAAANDPIDKLQFYTEYLPPSQFRDDAGRLTGINIDVLRAMLDHAGASTEIADVRMVPWARAYSLALTTPNHVVFGTARTPEREDKFIWVGPVIYAPFSVIGPADAPTPDSLADLHDTRIATVRDDVAERLLLNRGYPRRNLVRQNDSRNIVRLLREGRVQYWAYNANVAFYLLKKAGLSARFAPLFELYRSAGWFAVNPDSDPAAVAALRDSLKAVRKKLDFQAIKARYR